MPSFFVKNSLHAKVLVQLLGRPEEIRDQKSSKVVSLETQETQTLGG